MPVADNLISAGSDPSPGAQGHKMKLTREEPQNQHYKALAHGYWFWIDESDHKSKAVLEALNYLFVSQSGASKPGDPILTLPLSPPGQ